MEGQGSLVREEGSSKVNLSIESWLSLSREENQSVRSLVSMVVREMVMETWRERCGVRGWR